MKKTITSQLKAITPIVLSGLTVLGAGARNFVQKSSANSPNLIYIIADQMRLSALSCGGNKVISTPNLDRLASEGVLFTRAYTQCPVSIPSRAAMLTGNSLANTGVTNTYDAVSSAPGYVKTEPYFTTDSYDQVLSKNGYNCEYYGKWHNPVDKTIAYSNNPTSDQGLAKAAYTSWWQKASGLTAVPNFQTGAVLDGLTGLYYLPDFIDPRSTNPTGASSNETTFGNLLIDEKYTFNSYNNAQLLEAIERNKNQRFSIHCSYNPPHPPFTSAKPYYGSVKNSDIKLPANFCVPVVGSKYYNANELTSPYWAKSILTGGSTFIQDSLAIQDFTARYLELVKETDDKVGEVLHKLDSLGLTNNTMIIFCADHGEMMGGHGMNSKMVFYDEATRVPMIIRYPAQIPAGLKVNIPVSLIDLRPTIEDYLNMPTTIVDGKTLRPFIENSYDKSVNYFTVSEWNATTSPAFMLRTDRYKLMFGQGATATSIDALYDLKTDSLEQINILKKTNLTLDEKNIAEGLKINLLSWLKKVNSPYFESVKARAMSKPTNTYCLYKNDSIKIKIAGLTSLSSLPAGLTYKLVAKDTTIQVYATANSASGVIITKGIVSGVTKNISFDIQPALPVFVSSRPTEVSGVVQDANIPVSINCSDNRLTINIKSDKLSTGLAWIYNSEGVLLKQIKLLDNSYAGSTMGFSSGVYILKLSLDNKPISVKFIVK